MKTLTECEGHKMKSDSAFVKNLSKIAGKIAQNKFLQTIVRGLIMTMPALILGAFASLFEQIPFPVYQRWLVSAGIMPVLQAIVDVTTNMLAVYVTFCIAYTYAKNKKQDGISAGIIALISFLLVTPMTSKGTGMRAVTNLPLTWTGAMGLFTGMILSYLSAMMFVGIMKKNWTIKLPDSVPPFISKSFKGIVPGILIGLVWGIVRYLMALTPFKSLHQLIYGLIQLPLSHVGNNIWVIMFLLILTSLCWFFGIHGAAIASVYMPICMAADARNMAIINAGSHPTTILTWNWIQTVSNIGGAGCTLGLVILCLFARSKRYRDMGKLTIAPSLFGINEPVTYGMPMVLNFLTAIPYILLPAVLTGISYLLVKIGVLPVSNGVGAPTAIPIFAGFFNMGWRGAVWNAVEIVITIFAYLPFFRIMDRKAYEDENKANQKKEV